MTHPAAPKVTRTGRWLRGMLPDHNPLRRTTDRAEAAILALLLAAFLVGAPLLAIAGGRWAYDSALRAGNGQSMVRHQVTAVLIADAPNPPQTIYGSPVQVGVLARWTVPGGTTRIGEIPATPGAKAGSLVSVWVDTAGRLTTPPLRHSDAAGQRGLAVVLAPLALSLVMLGWWKLARRALNRRRMAAWDADWQATGPRWSHR